MYTFKIVIRNLKYQVVPIDSTEVNDIVISHGWDFPLMKNICNAANAYTNKLTENTYPTY